MENNNMKKCKHCGAELKEHAQKINGYCVCDNCYNEFVDTQHKIYLNNINVHTDKQWWNWGE